MKRTIAFFLSVILLASCSPSAMTPTVAPTETTIATATIEPTVTPTSIPTIPVDGLSVPDPHITNPELFDLSNPDSPIPQFVNAMKMAGIEVDAQQVGGNLEFEQETSTDGKPLIVGYYNLDPDPNKTGEPLEGKTPLLLATQDDQSKWIWKKVTIGNYGTEMGLNIGTQLGGYGFADYYQDLIKIQKEYFNYGMINTSMDHYLGPNNFNF